MTLINRPVRATDITEAGQRVRWSGLRTVFGHTVRVIVEPDTSYPFQSRYTIEVFDRAGLQWNGLWSIDPIEPGKCPHPSKLLEVREFVKGVESKLMGVAREILV